MKVQNVGEGRERTGQAQPAAGEASHTATPATHTHTHYTLMVIPITNPLVVEIHVMLLRSRFFLTCCPTALAFYLSPI
jgi:hypothetical protein